MSDSELSLAATELTEAKGTPFTKAKSVRSVASSGILQKTRYRANRKPPVEPQSIKRRRTTTQLTPPATQTSTVPHHSAPASINPEDEDSGEQYAEFGPEEEEDSEIPTQTTSRASSSVGDRTKRSFVHSHYSVTKSNSHEYWLCNYCTQRYKRSGGTSICNSHLRIEHKISNPTRQEAHEAVFNGNIVNAIKRQALKSSETMKIDKPTLEYLYIRWIIEDNIPFSNVRSKEFRTFLQALNPVANRLLPRSDSTIRKRVLSLFREGQKRLILYLHSAQTSIHISCDLWTSANNLGILAVVSHFVDEGGCLQTIPLNLKEVQGAHSGENMAEVVHNTLTQYDIRGKLGYFVMDNAESNDTLMQHLASKFRAEGVEYDPKLHRLRCNGHIINLAVQDFLYGSHPDLSKRSNNPRPSGEDLEEFNAWRKLGALGKLHNVAVFIESSSQRRQRFKAIEGSRGVKRDNSTRWNSWYMMLDWALKDSKAPIQRFISEEVQLPKEDVLTATDWVVLQDIHAFLANFHEVTKLTEGRKATINKVLPTLDFCFDKFEEAAHRYTDDPILSAMVDNGYLKLQKYWHKHVDRPSVYIAAIVLDPSQKWTYFEDWDPYWLGEAKKSMKHLWESTYRGADSILQHEPSVEPQSEFSKWFKARRPLHTDLDELDKYLLEPPTVEHEDVIAWWRDQRERLPKVTAMALDILSIPAMSAEPERVFSAAKHTIENRLKITAETLEATECLKGFFRTGILAQEDLNAVMNEDVDAEEAEVAIES